MYGEKRPNAGANAVEDEPRAKLQKMDDQAGMEGVQDTPADPFEKEKDAPADPRPGLSQEVLMDPSDATLNIVTTTGGRVLMALSDAGMQYLVAAARANVGVKAGRYFYEVRIMEVLNPTEPSRRAAAAPRQHVRVGFSLSGSSLFLGETEESICFDSEGMLISKRSRIQVAERFARGQVIGVLVNLDPSSPNANTVSLFRDGQRASEPQQIPENLRGRPLFPHVALRNVSLHVHFGPEPVLPLSFKCHTLQAAAREDVALAPAPAPAEGKYDVVFPVGMPDEGTFGWLDGFLEEHPQYVELSDRKIVEWAERSGLVRHKTNQFRTSNDRPDVSFGIPALDDLSARKVLRAVASLVPRHYVVMEVKSNLVKAERREFLRLFNAPHFRRIAHVVMGEPSEEHKGKVRSTLLAARQESMDLEWRTKQLERERKRQVEIRQKQLIEQRKATLAAQMKAAREGAATQGTDQVEAGKASAQQEEAKEPVKGEGKEDESKEVEEEAERKDDGAEKEEALPEKSDEAAEKKEGAEGEEEAEKSAEGAGVPQTNADAKEQEEDQPPKAQLTEDEANIWFKPQTGSDLTAAVMAASFANFTIPDLDEGFSEVRFEWQDEAASKAYLKQWAIHKKLTTRIEDLQPSDWFASRLAEWQRVLQEWQMKQKEFRQDPARAEAAKLRVRKVKKQRQKQEKDQKDQDDQKDVEQRPTEEGDQGGGAEKCDQDMTPQEGEGAKEDGGAEKVDADGSKCEQEADAAEDKAEEDDENEEDAEIPAVDIFTVNDVCDIGEGEPLFASFMFEDWTLMTLRFELFLLLRAFKKDVDDPDRSGIPEAHLTYYYSRYFRKQLNTRFFGTATVAELVNLVRDTVTIAEPYSVVTSQLAEDTEPVSDVFVKLAEEARRERQRRIDAGDETAKLRFSVLAAPAQQAPQQEQKAQSRVVVGNSAPRAYPHAWGQQARPSWQRPAYGQQSQFRSQMSPRWPQQAYAPKQQGGWR